MIPKTLIIDGTEKTAAYEIALTSTLPDDVAVTVTPDSSFVLSQVNKPDITAQVTQYQVLLSASQTEVSGMISAPALSAGSWCGFLNYTVEIQTQ